MRKRKERRNRHKLIQGYKGHARGLGLIDLLDQGSPKGVNTTQRGGKVTHSGKTSYIICGALTKMKVQGSLLQIPKNPKMRQQSLKPSMEAFVNDHTGHTPMKLALSSGENSILELACFYFYFILS